MTIYDKIFKLSKKIAKSLAKGKNPEDLQNFDFLSENANNRLRQDLSEDKVYRQIEHLKSIDKVQDWEEVYKRLEPRKTKTKSSYFKYVGIIIILISLAFIIFYQQSNTSYYKNPQNEIVAGTDKATLTLESGEVLILAKGNIIETNVFKSSGESLEYQKGNTEVEVVYNYLTVPRGGQFQIVLSDGTKVWLNADTKLKYPKSFRKGETRHVELLYGEAYFDVSPSAEHLGSKFKVLTKSQEIEVLGTEFNVNAYNDNELIYTTLVKGKINLSFKKQSEVLNPGEQVVLNTSSSIMMKQQVEVDRHIAWIRGYFNFRETSLKDIMKVLSRWYDVNIHIKSQELQEVKFSGLLSKKQAIQDILNGIQNTKFINAYEIKNKTITIE